MSKKEETGKEKPKKKTTAKKKEEEPIPLEDLVEDVYQSILEEDDADDKKTAEKDKAEEEEKEKKPKKTSRTKKKEKEIEAPRENIYEPTEFVDVIEKDASLEIPVTDLPGVGPATSHKLKESGLTTIRAIALSSISDLVNNADIGEKTASKLIKMCQEQVGLTFSTADNLYKDRMALDRITTGSDNLDELFGGGLETGGITELYGEFRTGKTQIAHQLCVTVQLPREQGGLGANAAYIDTEGTFRPERIVEMAERFGLDPKQVLQNITVGRAYTSDHQVNLAREIAGLARDKNIRLVVVDSLTSHFRAE